MGRKNVARESEENCVGDWLGSRLVAAGVGRICAAGRTDTIWVFPVRGAGGYCFGMCRCHLIGSGVLLCGVHNVDVNSVGQEESQPAGRD